MRPNYSANNTGRILPMVDETKRIVEWLRKEVGPEACRMILVAGMPGGTRTQRVKMAAFADGCSHAIKSIVEALESGDHLKDKTE
jgi:hypothetical protein